MKSYNKGISEIIIKNYVQTMNSITAPMSLIKREMGEFMVHTMNENIGKPFKAMDSISKNAFSLPLKSLQNIYFMSSAFQTIKMSFPKKQMEISTDIIKSVMKENNGVIYTRMLEPLNISRECLSVLEKNKEIEKVGRGMYISNQTLQDDYYLFQQKYKKVIFSHMNALYFHEMTEELPYVFTVTVPSGYHDDTVNSECNVFYVEKQFYELGLCEIKTPNGNMVRAYDIERCICDIIRSRNRMDFEQVKKSVKEYVKRKDKNMDKLAKYAQKMNIANEVMDLVGMYYE